MRCYGIARELALVLLPSFLFAAAADIVFFELFDPVQSPFVRDPLDTSRIVAFADILTSLWILGAAAIAITLMLESGLGTFRSRRIAEGKGTSRTDSGASPRQAGHLARQDDFPI